MYLIRQSTLHPGELKLLGVAGWLDGIDPSIFTSLPQNRWTFTMTFPVLECSLCHHDLDAFCGVAGVWLGWAEPPWGQNQSRGSAGTSWCRAWAGGRSHFGTLRNINAMQYMQYDMPKVLYHYICVNPPCPITKKMLPTLTIPVEVG